ncbi:MAG: peptidoglycan DD-metalloendopeptidase family protein [Amaricoccus sp.]
MTRAVLPLILPALLAAGVAGAAGNPADIAAASARVTAARAALDAAQAQPEAIVALGRAIADYDAALSALGADVRAAGDRAATLEDDLASRRSDIARLLATLETVGSSPVPGDTVHPAGPVAAARAASMSARLTPALHAAAETLAGELADLSAARALYASANGDLADGLATLNDARGKLAATLGTDVPPGEPGPDDPTLTILARGSENLTALAATLAGPQPAADPPAPAPGALRWPVAGSVVQRYEEPDAAGVREPGIVVAAPPFTLVTAPADATVRYAGPFLEYGAVLVLETDPATMVVLAGLGRLRVSTGATVRRGDLLGLLGGRALDVEEYVMQAPTDTGAANRETLYIEIRHGRGPVDPEPLFAGENG